MITPGDNAVFRLIDIFGALNEGKFPVYLIQQRLIIYDGFDQRGISESRFDRHAVRHTVFDIFFQPYHGKIHGQQMLDGIYLLFPVIVGGTAPLKIHYLPFSLKQDTGIGIDICCIFPEGIVFRHGVLKITAADRIHILPDLIPY